MHTLSISHNPILRSQRILPRRLTMEVSALVCAHLHCPTPGRPAVFCFEDQPVCSGHCALVLLRTAVSREQRSHTAATLKQRPRVQIGRILVDQGTIAEEALEQALRSQKATGAGALGSWLKQQVDLSEDCFTSALAIQSRCPVFRLGGFQPGPMALYLPQYLIERFSSVPLRLTGEPPHLALCFEDRVDYVLVQALERMHQMQVDAGLLTHSEFWRATAELAKAEFPSSSVSLAPDLDTMIAAMALTLEQAEVVNARLILINNFYWLRHWDAMDLAHDLICSVSAHAPAVLAGQLADQMLTRHR